jgi:hypothetical protein
MSWGAMYGEFAFNTGLRRMPVRFLAGTSFAKTRLQSPEFTAHQFPLPAHFIVWYAWEPLREGKWRVIAIANLCMKRKRKAIHLEF